MRCVHDPSKDQAKTGIQGTREQGANIRGQNSVVDAKETKSNSRHDQSLHEERNLPPRGFQLPKCLIIVGKETLNAQKRKPGGRN